MLGWELGWEHTCWSSPVTKKARSGPLTMFSGKRSAFAEVIRKWSKKDDSERPTPLPRVDQSWIGGGPGAQEPQGTVIGSNQICLG